MGQRDKKKKKKLLQFVLTFLEAIGHEKIQKVSRLKGKDLKQVRLLAF